MVLLSKNNELKI